MGVDAGAGVSRWEGPTAVPQQLSRETVDLTVTVMHQADPLTVDRSMGLAIDLLSTVGILFCTTNDKEHRHVWDRRVSRSQ